MKRKIRLFFIILTLAVSLPMLVWGFWPPRREMRLVPPMPAGGMLSLPKARTIQLKFAPVMRAGDSQIVELTLSAGAGASEAEPLYEDYTLIAEGRLDLPFGEVRPAEVVSTPLLAGGSATFYWEVTPRVEGALRGTAWLYLRLIPKAGGEETRQAVSAQLVEIRSKSIFMRTGREARGFGVVGTVIGVLLGFSSLRIRHNSKT